MKKTTLIAVLGILILSTLVFASEGNGNANTITANANIQQAENAVRAGVLTNVRERLANGEVSTIANNRIRKINAEIMELQAEKARIRTRLNLSEDELNATRLRAMLSNGRNAEIKIMPEVASERALKRLKLKNCNESENCTIELKEVGEGNKTRLVYEAKARKTFKVFGLFRNREEVRTQIDAETGEEILTRRPWWAWMASESDEADESEE